MKTSSIFFSLSLLLFLTFNSYSQNPGEPFHLETANGAGGIHSTGHRLLWENQDSTIYNVIYFSSDSTIVAQMDSSAILYNGEPATVYDTIYLSPVEPLEWYKKYYWRIVEFYSSSSVTGPVWYFKTMPNPICDYNGVLYDFEDGLGEWTIANDGGICVWDLFDLTRPYTMPPTSEGNVLAADADLCGSGTSTLTTITLNEPIANSQYGLIIEFDNDWRILDPNDAAYVEVSFDDEQTWEIVWAREGISERNMHEIIDVNEFSSEVFVRFRSIQPGWDWWWAIDNLHIYPLCPLTQFYPPYNLKPQIVTEPTLHVELNWSRGQFSDIFAIQRKNGLPNDPSSYSYIDYVSATTTNYLDTTISENQTYTYRVLSINIGISNEATVYIPDIITLIENENAFPQNFFLFQNYPNPFNPSTKITYQIAKSGNVGLKIFDILGKEVAELINEEKPVGKYEAEFNGQQLPSGIYFYQLKSGNKIETRKMVLMK